MTPARTDPFFPGQVRVLADIAGVLQSTNDPSGRIRRTLQVLRMLIPYDCAAVLVTQPNHDPQFIVEPPSMADDVGVRHMLVRTFATLNDQDGLDTRERSPEAAGPVPWSSHLAVPVIGLEYVIGVLFVGAAAPGVYGEERLGGLSVVANQLGAYLTMLDLRGERERLTRELDQLRVEGETGTVFQHIVGRSEAVRRLIGVIKRAAPSNATVLIEGESGTGKELIARAIHALSPRRARPFVAINCSAVPETLLESELFGHTRGAFTGAIRDRKGLVEEAHGGTLLLDEIGDTSPAFQPKLLRMLQHGEVRPVGSNRTERVDVRVIAASNKDLEQQIAQGSFRQDLYYRLAVVRLLVPPLRERTEDIPPLVEHFLREYCARHGCPPKTLAPPALARLMSYRWPGNVRELENRIESAVLLNAGPVIVAKSLFPQPAPVADAPEPLEQTIRAARERLEREKIAEAMDKAGGNRSQAARLLRITRATLYSKLKLYGLTDRADRSTAR